MLEGGDVDISDTGITTIKANAIGASELNVSGNGTSGQALVSDGDGTFSWSTITATVADGAVTTVKLADDSVTNAKIVNNAVSSGKIADNAVGATQLNVSGNGTSGQALVSDGDGSFSWSTISGSGTPADGSITTAKLADTAVTTAKLASGSVTNVKIGASEITGNKLADETVSTGKIADDAITAEKLAVSGNGTSGQALVSDGDGTFSWSTITASVGDGVVTTAKLAADAVTNAKIADDAVDTENIADDAITAALIDDGAVGTNALASDAVTSAKVADGAIDTDQIANNAVTFAKLPSNFIRSVTQTSLMFFGNDGGNSSGSRSQQHLNVNLRNNASTRFSTNMSTQNDETTVNARAWAIDASNTNGRGFTWKKNGTLLADSDVDYSAIHVDTGTKWDVMINGQPIVYFGAIGANSTMEIALELGLQFSWRPDGGSWGSWTDCNFSDSTQGGTLVYDQSNFYGQAVQGGSNYATSCQSDNNSGSAKMKSIFRHKEGLTVGSSGTRWADQAPAFMASWTCGGSGAAFPGQNGDYRWRIVWWAGEGGTAGDVRGRISRIYNYTERMMANRTD